MLSLALLAIAAYAATNVDNLFVLLAFLSEPGGRRAQVIGGQFIGSLALIAAALLLAALLTRLPAGYVGLLGILPIGVGVSKAWHGRKTFCRASAHKEDDEQETRRIARGSSWWTVACVAIANGSDNLAVYVPLYASHAHGESAVISLVFVLMIGVWCAGAVWLVGHPLLGAPIRRYGNTLLPLVLIVIGVSVIVQNGTLPFVFGL
ncbi:cadmium resistance protein CadD (predicted permease) [Paraburkholderia sp. GAS199]|uniref:cadmium resistance transporter n=1 Tax=Paraburkholderia sp. GAS199 TaxID=3035126 RepID=UPI003D1FA0B3